jgi:hypothetical protein
MNAHKVIISLKNMGNSGVIPMEYAEFMIRKIHDSIKFEFDCDNTPHMRTSALEPLIGTIRLPYKLCYFDIPGIGSLLASEINDAERYIAIHPFFKWENGAEIATFPIEFMLAIDKETQSITSLSKDEQVIERINKLIDSLNPKDYEHFIIGLPMLVLGYLAVLNCSNVTCVDNHPSPALSKKRAKNGKPPLFSYKTLHIHTDKTSLSGISHPSDRSSPRIHLRRGHIRRIDDVRTVWVNSCVVGDKKKGVIVKDYKIH